MEYSVTFIHKLNKREFVISNRTKPNILKLLIKKAFHLQTDIRYLKHIGGGVPLQIHEIFNFPNEYQFEIILEDQSEDKQRSNENCSQKNMSKMSGRKYPPSEKELLDSKFYIDDFQLFMSEINDAKANRFFGIIFFTSKKKALFLGKKILRQLIFQFDQIEFFYALHPIKMHNTSALLGQVLVFSLFQGKKMIHQRQFPEQITAAEEIINYLKNLIKVGELDFHGSNKKRLGVEKKRTKNLISVSEQRSFDQKNDLLPKKNKQEFEEKNLTVQFFKIKDMSPDHHNHQSFSPPPSLLKFETPNNPHKSAPIPQPPVIPPNIEISFQSQFYQPQWFKQGPTLDRLEKSFLSAFIKESNPTLINFCQGLELKKIEKQQLNKKLLKVFLNQMIDDRLRKSGLSTEDRQFARNNQDNRKSYIFSVLLKFGKFGNFDDFVQAIKKANIKVQQNQSDVDELPQLAMPSLLNKRNSYLQLAKQIQGASKSKGFFIKLMQPNDQQEKSPQKQRIQLIGQHSNFNAVNQQIAKGFHSKGLSQKITSASPSRISFKKDQFQQSQKKQIQQLIREQHDTFLIQNFIPTQNCSKKFVKVSNDIVKKYLKDICSRYTKLRERVNLSNLSLNKLQKLQMFMSLLYFIYKNRHINKKQLKAFFYLYIWSDLNILSAFQLYLEDRDIDEMVDTLYAIDYAYYLNGKYGIDMNEVEAFTQIIEEQLIILFLLSQKITIIEERLALQKFIRAGDITLDKLNNDRALRGEVQFLNRVLQICREKKKNLEQHSKNENKQQIQRLQKNHERCLFVEQIKPAHFKHFDRVFAVKQCINSDQSRIHDIFDTYDRTNELVRWIDDFSQYISQLDQYHMPIMMKKWTTNIGLDSDKLKLVKEQLLKGIYESYIITQDNDDAIDSIQHIFKKLDKDEKSSPFLKSP